MSTMKRIFSAGASVVLLAGLVAILPTQTATAAPPRQSVSCGEKVLKANGRAWKCTFADEFSGTSIDSRKWIGLTTARSGLKGNGDCWVDTPANVAVGDGVLRLTTRKEPAPITCTTNTGTTFDTEYTSGAVSTFGKFDQAFGRWEIRARFPQITTVGSQGALWLYPRELKYGAGSGEIDIAEFYSTYPDRVIPFIHYNSATSDASVTNNYCMVSDPWNFHRYSVEWLVGRITISIDGNVCVDHRVNPASPLVSPQPFDHPYTTNLMQSLGVGVNSRVDATPLPLTTEVDWVHVWS
jgi:beta-glucanase (GH16 family)